ncbi:AfsR/SARP family transcriptional regulator [Streptomyces sp. NPDC049585]|uniref:AfsR/SARP family transcriptional regulator n=1 Tax=Streptomyces sp. NPDC049585 TaxID=3155154 RepID=UPI00344A7E6F
MQIDMLGPLVAHENGILVTPIARKPRQVFSLLALHAGAVVKVPALIEELWGTRPPASALTTLQTYILQVRRGITVALGASHNGPAKDVLRTCYGGYVLDVDPANTDVHAYERLVEAGRQAAEEGDLEAASALQARALGLWRGDALVDVHAGMRIEMEVARLEESRLGVLEAHLETELRLGRHAGLLPELSALTARHPMHENLWALFMVALHRSGRTSQALEAFIKLRRTLVRELGVEPSARLQNLQHAILRADPEIDAVGAGIPTAAGLGV